MSQDWDIKQRGEACTGSGQPFADGQRYVSRLLFGEEGYAREDYAEENWNESLAEGALSVWRSTFRLPPPPPEEALKKETAESLLRKFMEEDNPGHANAIYILGVMLERRRILAEKDVQLRDDGTKLRVYEHRKTGETFVISDPGLKLTDLQHVQAEVVALLEGRPPPGQETAEVAPEDQTAPESA